MPLTVGLGLAWAFAIGAFLIMQNFGGRTLHGRRLALAATGFGAIVGAVAPLMSFLLMLFKNVQHAHLTPDFPNETLLGILYRVPAWGIAGALFGIAAFLYLVATTEEQHNHD